MKSVRMAAVLLVVTLVAVVANSFAVRGMIGGIIERVESAENDEYEEIFKDFKDMETYVSLTVDHEDMMNIELAFAELIGAVQAGDEESVTVIKSRLKYSLEHLRRLSGINIESRERLRYRRSAQWYRTDSSRTQRPRV